MEEYMENLKSLRSQMNEIEDEATKRSFEEQKQKTEIDALENDLNLVRSETKRLNQEASEMLIGRERIGSEVAAKKEKMAVLEFESHTLSQTLELLQQEMASTLVRLQEKSSFYTKVTDELKLKLQEQQEWFNSNRQKMGEDEKSEGCLDEQMVDIEGIPVDVPTTEVNLENMGDDIKERHKDLINQLESAKSKVGAMKDKKSAVVLEITKAKQLLEQSNQRIEATPLALNGMDANALKEELGTLVAEKDGELADLHWLKNQIKQLKGFSEVVTCRCGKEYKVELTR